MVVIAMAYVFELTVRVHDLLEPSDVNIELTRVIDRPQEENVGEERIVHILFAHGRFHAGRRHKAESVWSNYDSTYDST